MSLEQVPAKTIITKTKSPESWFGHDYNMNIYRGCCHGCIYCDSRSACYRIENFDQVRAKQNALLLIDKELRSKVKTGVVGTGAMSDPYNPFEKEANLTRGALELINQYGFGAAVATKSDLVTRDVDVFRAINEHSPVCIKLTVTTYEDDLCRKIEPHVSTSAERFEALAKLAKNHIFCGVLLMPILPFINDTEENITGIIQACADAGAKFVYPGLGVTLRQNQREYFYHQLDREFPGLRARYQRIYGDQYQCGTQAAKQLYGRIAELCTRYGLLYKMRDIISAYQSKVGYTQISLF